MLHLITNAGGCTSVLLSAQVRGESQNSLGKAPLIATDQVSKRAAFSLAQPPSVDAPWPSSTAPCRAAVTSYASQNILFKIHFTN